MTADSDTGPGSAAATARHTAARAARWGRRLGVASAVGVVILLALALSLRLYTARRLDRAVARFEAEAGSLELRSYAPVSWRTTPPRAS